MKSGDSKTLQQKETKEVKVKARKKGKGSLAHPQPHPFHHPACLLNQKMK